MWMGKPTSSASQDVSVRLWEEDKRTCPEALSGCSRYFSGKRLIERPGFDLVSFVPLGKPYHLAGLPLVFLCHVLFSPSEIRHCMSLITKCDRISLGRPLPNFLFPSLLPVFIEDWCISFNEDQKDGGDFSCSAKDDNQRRFSIWSVIWVIWTGLYLLQ